MSSLAWYAGAAGDPGNPPAAWPLGEMVALDEAGPTVVLFAHPRCPCTRASLTELERLHARSAGGFAFRVLFFEPENGDEAWRETVLWQRARSIEGTTVVADPGGRMSQACGAATSGIVGVYAPDGSLLFWGGVTASRGHEGPSTGLDAVARLVGAETPNAGAKREQERALVYGCSLLGSCGTGAAQEARP